MIQRTTIDQQRKAIRYSNRIETLTREISIVYYLVRLRETSTPIDLFEFQLK